MTGFWLRTGMAAAVAATAAMGVSAVSAQPKAEGRTEMLQRLVDCRKVAEDAARLACYDAQVEAIDQAEAKGDIVVVDREQARAVRRQAFGFTMPSMTLFERGEKPEEVENVAGVVKSAHRGGDGKWVVELEDGAVWAQVDTEKVPRDPRPGMEVKIRKAAIGSYFMNLGGQRAVRARRQQ